MTSMEVWYVEKPNLAVSVRRMQLKEGLFWRYYRFLQSFFFFLVGVEGGGGGFFFF